MLVLKGLVLRLAMPRLAAAICAAGIGSAGFSAPAAAQDAALADAWMNGGCPACHGANGEGGEPGKMPPGPRLQRTRLTMEQVIEVITCGRPGTGMPYHLGNAYTEVQCYDMPLGAPPDRLPRGVALEPEMIERIAQYVKSI